MRRIKFVLSAAGIITAALFFTQGSGRDITYRLYRFSPVFLAFRGRER